MTKIDIFNPQISKVSKGLEGKAVLIYGDNSTGKTLQATRMEKPYYIGFEMGIRAISGIPFLPVNSWVDFKRINAQLTDPKTLDKAKELYQTLIFDEVFASALLCQQWICRTNGASHMGEQAPPGENRPNLWTAYQAEYFSEISKLLKSGYTLIFIGHQAKDRDTGQIIPKGDVRSMEVIRDNADITAYLTSNGIDDNGKVIKSSAHFAQTPEYFARSRYDYMDTYLEEFTAEGLERIIAEGIEKEEKVSGIKAVSFEEQQESITSDELDYDALQKEINEVGMQIAQAGYLDELVEIVEKRLGRGVKVTDAKKTEVEALAVILLEVKALAGVLLS